MHYLGMVVAPDGSFLADSHVEGRPTVNDMARLLAHAMRRPLAGKGHRPRRIHVRGHPQWREPFPHLDELGIKVAVHRELVTVQRAYQGYLRQQRDTHRVGMVQPTAEQQAVEQLFPAIAQWVRGYGHIEIGDQEMFGFVARALDYGGLAFEDDRPDTLARAGTPPDQLSPEAVKGILVNPIYTGVGPFPRLVEDAAWVRACAKLIEEEGPQQFLVNLLHVLRECFQEDSPP
jgi:hypothetical protein